MVVTISEKNDVQAFKLTLTNEPLFTQIKNDPRARIQDTPVSAEALLPGGPYSLWREDEHTRRVKDLVSAFAQFPRLPKMLHPATILETLRNGCEAGTFVMRLVRPDQSVRTFWRTRPDDIALKDSALEIVLPEHATLSEVPAELLAPDTLPGLWTQPTITFQTVQDYFSGQHVVQVPKDGFEEPLMIPKAEPDVLAAAVERAVSTGFLWLTTETTSLYAEDVPTGILTPAAQLHAPPSPLAAADMLPGNLPDAWSGDTTTARAIADALSHKVGTRLPWPTVQKALDGAFRAGFLERTHDSAAWPCDAAGASFVTVQLPQATPPSSPSPVSIRESDGGMMTTPGVRVAHATLQASEVQNLGDEIGDVMQAAAGYGLRIQVNLELGSDAAPPDEVVERVNEVLKRVAAELELR
jgi:hypothetical protein